MPCKCVEENGHCGHGNRTKRVQLLHGSLLLAWKPILSFHHKDWDAEGALDDLDDDHDESDGQIGEMAAPKRY